jgi:HD superfamily phosphohydrolase
MRYIFDMIHGYIEYTDREVLFLDNPWTKRLKRIKQLGLLDHVFPSASHSRFEHSLGVSYLGEHYLNALIKHSDGFRPSDTDKLCVKLAGLFHDLGHGPFSHVFDNVILKDPTNTHEMRSRQIVEYVFKDVGTLPGLSSAYAIDYIKEMIEPVTNQYISNPLFHIINNTKTNIDVDKFDYLQRDAQHIGLDYSFNPSRIINKSVVKGENIVYNHSLASNIQNMFSTRYKFHKDIYNHKTAKLIELMLGDAMLAANDTYDFNDMSRGPEFLKLDDSIYSTLLHTTNNDLQTSKSILQRIEKRDLYKELCTHTGLTSSSEINDFISDNYSDMRRNKIRYINLRYSHCNGAKSPLENVVFTQNLTPDKSDYNAYSYEETNVMIYNTI